MTGLKVSSFDKRIDELLSSLPGNDTDKGKMLGVSRQTISAWRNGDRSPKRPVVNHIANTLNVSVKWLMGFDVPREESPLPNHPDILPVTTRRIPILGAVACGEPIYAEEDFSATMAVNSNIDCDFALRCQGDSMINARIYDGDIVYVKKQEYVDDGAVVVALIDDEATLKRIYHLGDGRVMLQAENPRYAPIIIGGESETRTFRVLGKAVAFHGTIV